MRTFQNLCEIMRVERVKEDLPYLCQVEVHVLFNGKQYYFLSNNTMACNRIEKASIVSNKIRLYGYTLKGAYDAFYKEFKKKKTAGEWMLQSL